MKFDLFFISLRTPKKPLLTNILPSFHLKAKKDSKKNGANGEESQNGQNEITKENSDDSVDVVIEREEQVN